MKIIDVPKWLQPTEWRHNIVHQRGPRFEEYLYSWMVAHQNEINTSRSYLPIFWTCYYVNNGFGSPEAVSAVKGFLETIPHNQRCWSVIEYDDGLKFDRPANLDLFYCGGRAMLTLPLLSDPWSFTEAKKDTVASFVGNLDTHPLRRLVCEKLLGQPGIVINGSAGEDPFRDWMMRSHYAICPRGYGLTSFRMYEAIQMGVVPVYISDKHVLPFNDELNWRSFAMIETLDTMGGLGKRLCENVSNGTWARQRQRLLEIQNRFTMEAVCRWLKGWLERAE